MGSHATHEENAVMATKILVNPVSAG